MATLSSRRPGHRLLNRAPPPTPIATAKGVRSAVVDDVVFSEYLESSLRIPKLALPRTYSIPSSRSVSPSSSGSRSPLRRLPAVDLMALRERDGDAIRMLLAAAEEIGAFRVEGHGVNRAEVRSAVDAVRGGTEGGFLLAGEKNRELAGRCYGHGRTEHGIAVEELRWFRPMRPEDDSALQQLLPPDSYRVLRDLGTVPLNGELKDGLIPIAEDPVSTISLNAKLNESLKLNVEMSESVETEEEVFQDPLEDSSMFVSDSTSSEGEVINLETPPNSVEHKESEPAFEILKGNRKRKPRGKGKKTASEEGNTALANKFDKLSDSQSEDRSQTSEVLVSTGFYG